MKKLIEKMGMEVFWGGVFGIVAIAAAIISLVVGEVDSSATWGCVKDVAGTLTDVIVLLAVLKGTAPKKKGDFLSAFNARMEELYTKYNLIFAADTTEKGKSLHRHNIAPKLDGMITKDAGKTTIRFFDLELNKSKLTFFVQKTNFADRTESTAKDVFSMLENKLKDIAKVVPKYSTEQTSIEIHFNEQLINENDAKTVSEIVDDVIFYYIMEYKK